MTNEHHGGCLCGAVRFMVSGALRGVIHCHCGQCLKTHGHAAAYTNAPREALRFSREDGLRWFNSSEWARRGFCAECGASLVRIKLIVVDNEDGLQRHRVCRLGRTAGLHVYSNAMLELEDRENLTYEGQRSKVEGAILQNSREGKVVDRASGRLVALYLAFGFASHRFDGACAG